MASKIISMSITMVDQNTGDSFRNLEHDVGIYLARTAITFLWEDGGLNSE